MLFLFILFFISNITLLILTIIDITKNHSVNKYQIFTFINIVLLTLIFIFA